MLPRLLPVALLLWLALPATALTIDNGLAPPNPANVLTANPSGDFDLEVRDGGCAGQSTPCPNPGSPTTVEVQGSGFEFRVRDLSTLIVTGGNHFGTIVQDGATLRALGGLLQERVSASGNARIVWDGASTLDEGFGLSLRDSAQLTMFSGSVDSVSLTDDAVAFFMGGRTFESGVGVSGNAQLFLSGGLVGRGEILGSLLGASGNGFVSWTGGQIAAGIWSTGNAVVRIAGSDFAIDGVPVGPGEILATSGRLTGTVADGTAIDNFFQRFSDGTTFGTILLVPEPGTGLLVGLGLVALAGRRC